MAILERTPDALVMRCALGTVATYGFCKMQFLLGRPGKGIDLSGFDSIDFDLRYTGRPPHLIKLHVMNFEPEFSTPGDWNSQRFNEAEIELPEQATFTIPMNVLRTADWWRSTHKVPLSKSYARFDRVTAVELSTGAVPHGQAITLEVRSIRFHGKWISKTALLMGLVFAWIACGILGLSLGLLHFRESLSATTSRLDHLAAVDRERKAAETAREAALAEAVSLARQRSNFLAQMSHELRTPLNAIIGYAQLLKRDRHLLDDRQAAGLATIHESGQHLLTLINDILDLARVPAPGGDDGVRLRFEVADTGIGMSAQQRGRLFHPFEQVADVLRRAGGTGLGLAISQQLVRLMGGTIDVASESGKGSAFWFELVAPVATGSPANAPPPRTFVGYEGERKRLLIVDDVPQNRAMLVDLLQSLGFVVAAAENGLECLVLLDGFKPDLIVMDVMMPVIDGNETTRRIRRMPAWSRVPVIAVTASASPDDEARCREAGADAFVPKPVEHDVLLRTVGTLLALTWIAGSPASEAPQQEDEVALVVPPTDEIEVLWQLVRIGNMRRIREQASRLRTLDPAYAPFADHLEALARGYHSKDLAAFVARYRAEDALRPAL